MDKEAKAWEDKIGFEVSSPPTERLLHRLRHSNSQRLPFRPVQERRQEREAAAEARTSKRKAKRDKKKVCLKYCGAEFSSVGAAFPSPAHSAPVPSRHTVEEESKGGGRPGWG